MGLEGLVSKGRAQIQPASDCSKIPLREPASHSLISLPKFGRKNPSPIQPFLVQGRPPAERPAQRRLRRG
jgi:hypothetical protein